MLYFILVVALCAALYLLGPRTKVDLTLCEPTLPRGSLAELDQWVANNEATTPNLIEGTEAVIRWHGGKQKTEYVVLYLHGFSASRQELSPVPQAVADAFGANSYYIRFSGHGCGAEAQANATVNDWLNDSLQAYRIAEKLGEKIILLGTSTGASFATWLLARYPEKFSASVLFSPNFRVAQRSANLLIGPWGKQILHATHGKTRIRPDDATGNANRQRFWTGTYPTRSYLPMIAATRLAREANHRAITCPSMLVWSPLDEVVDTSATRTFFDRFGSLARDELVLKTQHDPRHHLVTGDIMAPANTQITIERVCAFLQQQL